MSFERRPVSEWTQVKSSVKITFCLEHWIIIEFQVSEYSILQTIRMLLNKSQIKFSIFSLKKSKKETIKAIWLIVFTDFTEKSWARLSFESRPVNGVNIDEIECEDSLLLRAQNNNRTPSQGLLYWYGYYDLSDKSSVTTLFWRYLLVSLIPWKLQLTISIAYKLSKYVEKDESCWECEKG